METWWGRGWYHGGQSKGLKSQGAEVIEGLKSWRGVAGVTGAAPRMGGNGGSSTFPGILTFICSLSLRFLLLCFEKKGACQDVRLIQRNEMTVTTETELKD